MVVEGVGKVAVIGSGQMGSGIAEVTAVAGYETALLDVDPVRLEEALSSICRIVEGAVEKGKITASKAETALSRLKVTSDLREAVSGATLVIEAVPEDLSLKRSVFRELDRNCPPETILASNTSSLSISAISAATVYPGRVIGTHFFYPPYVMKLVEVVKGVRTTNEIYRRTMLFIESLGKVAITAPDTPGFVVNRLITPLLNEAAFLVMEGVSPQDVDKAAKLGLNLPMGPLELADFVGLDVQHRTMEGLYLGFCDPKYRPCPLVRNMVESGHLGRKSGRGFYQYSTE